MGEDWIPKKRMHIKMWTPVLVFILLFFGMPSLTSAQKIESIPIFVNDHRVVFEDTPAIIDKGFTYIPVANMAQELGYSVAWNPETLTVVLKKEDKSLTLHTVEQKILNDVLQQLDGKVFVQNGRTMAPLRIVAEYFGFQVEFIADIPAVRITDGTEMLLSHELYEKYKDQILLEQRSKKSGGKPAYLTFDDGPIGKSTIKILDILAQYNVSATFFMLDGYVAKHPDLVKRMVEDGHAIGSHGVTHQVSKFYRSKDSVINEMKQGLERLQSITGIESKLIRVPYGSVPHMKASYIEAVHQAGYKMWDWNVDSYDWKYSNDANKIYTTTVGYIQKVAERGQSPVILMHDKNVTAEILPKIIEYLLNNGYDLLPITEDIKPLSFK